MLRVALRLTAQVCAPIAGEICDRLRLPPMVERNTEKHATAFTVSIDYRVGTTTGISAHDRAATIAALCDARTRPEARAALPRSRAVSEKGPTEVSARRSAC
jgi:3,4-dihydroxy-2-butanone 4-phosphate synthase